MFMFVDLLFVVVYMQNFHLAHDTLFITKSSQCTIHFVYGPLNSYLYIYLNLNIMIIVILMVFSF